MKHGGGNIMLGHGSSSTAGEKKKEKEFELMGGYDLTELELICKNQLGIVLVSRYSM